MLTKIDKVKGMVVIKKRKFYRGIVEEDDDDDDGERSTRLSNIMNISSFLIRQNYGNNDSNHYIDSSQTSHMSLSKTIFDIILTQLSSLRW
jgi:hypothetical protein